MEQQFTPAEIEAGLSSKDWNTRLKFAELRTFTPTQAQINRAIVDPNHVVMGEFISRKDVILTPKQINDGLTDHNPIVRRYFVGSYHENIGTEKSLNLLNDPDKIVRELAVYRLERFNIPFAKAISPKMLEKLLISRSTLTKMRTIQAMFDEQVEVSENRLHSLLNSKSEISFCTWHSILRNLNSSLPSDLFEFALEHDDSFYIDVLAKHKNVKFLTPQQINGILNSGSENAVSSILRNKNITISKDQRDNTLESSTSSYVNRLCIERTEFPLNKHQISQLIAKNDTYTTIGLLDRKDVELNETQIANLFTGSNHNIISALLKHGHIPTTRQIDGGINFGDKYTVQIFKQLIKKNNAVESWNKLINNPDIILTKKDTENIILNFEFTRPEDLSIQHAAQLILVHSNRKIARTQADVLALSENKNIAIHTLNTTNYLPDKLVRTQLLRSSIPEVNALAKNKSKEWDAQEQSQKLKSMCTTVKTIKPRI